MTWLVSVLYVDAAMACMYDCAMAYDIPGMALCNHHGVQKIFFSVNFISPSQPFIPVMTTELVNLYK